MYASCPSDVSPWSNVCWLTEEPLCESPRSTQHEEYYYYYYYYYWDSQGHLPVELIYPPGMSCTGTPRDGLGHLLTEWEVSCHLWVSIMPSGTRHDMSAHHSMDTSI